jgi:hypothetical protein
MQQFPRTRRFVAAAALATFALAAPISIALAQDGATAPGHTMAGHDHSQMQAESGHGHDQGMMEPHRQMMQGMSGQHGGGQMHGAALGAPGQDAFGTIQEVVRVLEADPKTDWTKVDLEGLRQHLIDMNEVTLKADAKAKPIDGGLSIDVTGAGRTLAAIQRMIPAHAQELNKTKGWSAKAETLPTGVRLTVTSADSKQVAHIRGLGFIGLLASGSHHQPHHLAMARGEFAHAH